MYMNTLSTGVSAMDLILRIAVAAPFQEILAFLSFSASIIIFRQSGSSKKVVDPGG